MIPGRNPPHTWVSARDHGNPVSPGQKRPPRGTLATPVPQRRQPGGKAAGYSAAGTSALRKCSLYGQNGSRGATPAAPGPHGILAARLTRLGQASRTVRTVGSCRTGKLTERAMKQTALISSCRAIALSAMDGSATVTAGRSVTPVNCPPPPVASVIIVPTGVSA